MAVEWNITPSTEYTTYGNGIKLTIPSENPPAKYIITYSDDNGCMGSTTVIVRTDCGGGGDDPDPKPTSCVTPLDNVGQECVLTKTATQEFIDAGFACEDTHWWSGPLDGEGDRGLKATGDTTDDSIRCNSNNLEFEVIDDWISYRIDTSTAGEFGKGVMRYTIARNSSQNPRHGILKVRTKENEHPDRAFDGHSTSDYFCREWCNIHFYQQGNGGSPDPGQKQNISYFEDLFKSPFGHGDLTTTNTHLYLNAVYNQAKTDFDNHTGGYTMTIYTDSGIKTCSNTGGDENLAFNTYIGWTIAMCLTEIDASKANALYNKAYSTFGGDMSVYGYSNKNNPHIARIAASIEYAVKRSSWNSYVTNVRTEKGINSNGSFDPTTLVRNDYQNYYPNTANIAPSLSFMLSNCQTCDSEIDDDAKSRYSNDNVTNARTKQALMDKDFCGVYCAKIFGDAMGTDISSRANLIDEYLLHGSWASDAIKSVYYGRYRPPRYPNNVTYNGYPLVNKAIEDTTTCEEHPDMTPEQAAYNMYPNSYCSGHASAIWGVACILAYIYPSNFTDIFKRAWVFANNRIVSRYHFYSDTIVGRELGGLILPTLMYYDKFRNSL